MTPCTTIDPPGGRLPSPSATDTRTAARRPVAATARRHPGSEAVAVAVRPGTGARRIVCAPARVTSCAGAPLATCARASQRDCATAHLHSESSAQLRKRADAQLVPVEGRR
jgi:hypothetical protein